MCTTAQHCYLEKRKQFPRKGFKFYMFSYKLLSNHLKQFSLILLEDITRILLDKCSCRWDELAEESASKV